jgi:hypothetical protein
MGKYSGKTAPNSTALIDSVAWSPSAPSLKPTLSGTSNSVGAKGSPNPSRTSSPAAQSEKLTEKH